MPRVLQPDDHGFELRPGVGHQYERSHNPVRHHVIHWTGGTASIGDPHDDEWTLDDTLRSNGFGYHTIIDLCGTVLQTCDPARVVAAGSGWNNRWAWQTAFVGRGLPAPDGKADTTAEIHGENVDIVLPTPEQVASCIAIQGVLHRVGGIANHVPRRANGELYSGYIPQEAQRRYRGILEHLHVDGGKVDAGMVMTRVFGAMGF